MGLADLQVKRRHHYVPRFYLRAFASAPDDPKRVHIYNISRSLVIADASLRDQCYAHKLYGEDDVIEDALAVIEGEAANVITRIRTTRRCPRAESHEHAVLRIFIAYQMARTESAIANVIAEIKAMERAAFAGTKVPEDWGKPEDQAMLISMSLAPVAADSLVDLSMTLVEAQGGLSFITSDSPVFQYNRYCEGIKHFGVTGVQSEGFQIFFPISPELLLLLCDPLIYKVGSRGAERVTASKRDIEALNRLQFVSARNNLYFSDWAFAPQCKAISSGVAKLRATARPRVNIADAEHDHETQLLHMYVPMPQLGLDLSFLGIRKSARRVKLFDRARRMRRPYRAAMSYDTAGGKVQHTRYVVRRRQ